MPTGSYDPYHLGDTGHTATDQGVNSYLGTWQSDSTDLGWFPQTQDDVSAMWNDKIGITCVECFFYISHFDSDGMKYQFAADIRDRPGNSTWCLYQVRLTTSTTNNSFSGLRVRFRYVLGDSTNGTSGGDISLQVGGVDNWITTDEWYHSILRYNSTDSQWEWLVGRLGKNSDGTDAGGTVDSLNNDFWGPNESLNNHEPGSYHRMIRSQANSGPLLLFGRSTNLSTSPNDGLRGFIGTQMNNATNSRRDRSWPGGHCEHRFWKSGMDSVRTYGQLENLKNTDVDGDQHPELVHCFRLNETGSSLDHTSYEDVGTLDGTFISSHSNISSTSPDSGYPYDIVGQGPSGPTDHEVSATIAGQTNMYNFYGSRLGTLTGGEVVYYEEAPSGIADGVLIDLRVASTGEISAPDAILKLAVRDPYNQLWSYWPGTQTPGFDEGIGGDNEVAFLNWSEVVADIDSDITFNGIRVIDTEPEVPSLMREFFVGPIIWSDGETGSPFSFIAPN
jgi:hypothetical protein